MLCNLISQTLAVLQRAYSSKEPIATIFSVLELNIVHFGATRGSGHTTTIEALTNIYSSAIICASERHKNYYDGRAKGTKIRSWFEAVQQKGQPKEDVEVVFIDNWTDIQKTEGDKVWKDLEFIGTQYDRTSTVFALIH